MAFEIKDIKGYPSPAGYVAKEEHTVTFNGRTITLFADPLVTRGMFMMPNGRGGYDKLPLHLLDKAVYEWQSTRLSSNESDDSGTAAQTEDHIEWMRNQYDREHSDQMDTPRPRVCDCGGEKANTTHSDWCSIHGGVK